MKLNKNNTSSTRLTIHDVFRQQATKMPDQIAVTTEDSAFTLSYNDLHRRSDSLAQAILLKIKRLSTGPNPRMHNGYIAVMTQRGIGMIVSLLAILKTNSAYVPVDPSFPRDRQAYIFGHAQCSVLVVDEETYKDAVVAAGDALPPMLTIDRNTGLPVEKDLALDVALDKEVEASPFLPTDGDPRQVAYVLYTSGSTGKPKGVQVYHDSVLNIINWFGEDIGVNEKDRVLGLTTYCFDISVLEIFMPLTRGATLVVTSTQSQKDPFLLIDVLKRNKITVMQATPTTYEMCLATGWTGASTIHFLVGGEAFRPKLKIICKNCKSMRNVYGPTETTIWSSSYLFNETNNVEDGNNAIIPIGKPISETVFYIVNPETLELLLDGEEGELCIGGLGVAKGYIHAPELTAAKFIENPYSRQEGADGGGNRVYRTGDIAKKLPDGNYTFCNRIDDQVKLHGYRIELGEIETVLVSHPLINQAVVLVKEDTLVAYLKPNLNIDVSQIPTNEAEWKDILHKKLPHYMIPSYYIMLSEFPQTANGKLDKKLFPTPPQLAMKAQKNKELETVTTTTRLIQDPQQQQRDVAMAKTIKNRDIIEYVRTVVEDFNGLKITARDSLAAIGIDSLAAVYFRQSIQKAFDGLLIETSLLFDPDATITTIAMTLQERLLKEKPYIFKKLNLVVLTKEVLLQRQQEEQVGGGDIESQKQGGITATSSFGENNRVKYHMSAMDAFRLSILNNRLILEGIRGLLSIWVFYDHFGIIILGQNAGVDVYMFILMSGLSTSLQYAANSPSPVESLPVFTPLTSASSKIVPSECSVTTLHPVGFDWKRFVWYRWIGLFPMYYVAIILLAPYMLITTNTGIHKSLSEYIGLIIMYLICLQSWTPWSRDLLSDLYYTGIIWNIFLVYAFWKYIYMHPTLALAWRRVILTVLIAALIVTYVFQISMRNPSTYILHFLAGCLMAYIYKEAFVVYYTYRQMKEQEELQQQQHQEAAVTTAAVTSIQTYLASSWLLKTGQFLRSNDYIYRYMPDMIASASVFILIWRYNTTPAYNNFMRIFGLSFLLWITILWWLMQDKDAPSLLKQYILPSQALVLLGELSYPMYIYQLVLINYYLAAIVKPFHDHDDPHHHSGNRDTSPSNITNQYGWMRKEPIWLGAIAFVIVVAFSYAMQRIFQEKVVPWIINQCTAFYKHRILKNQRVSNADYVVIADDDKVNQIDNTPGQEKDGDIHMNQRKKPEQILCDQKSNNNNKLLAENLS